MDESLEPYVDFIDRCTKNWRWACRKLFGQRGSFDLFPFQENIIDAFFTKPFPLFVGSRGSGKSFLIAVYAILRALFSQDLKTGAKIVIVGPSFRQTREVFKYVETIWRMSPILQECAPEGPKTVIDRCELRIGNSVIIAVPLGGGEKIRGLRATTVLADEIAMIPEDIMNTVVRGFTSVSQNPMERVLLYKKLKDAGLTKAEIGRMLPKNQIILTGTAYYKFNHFYRIFDQYMNIIENKVCGPASQIIDSAKDTDAFIDYRDYVVIRLPADKLPEGFLDETQMANSRIQMSDMIYNMEYNTEFADDSQGFYPRSMIDSCVPKPSDLDTWPQKFCVELRGEPGYPYTMGVDPARTRDNLAIGIAKICDYHTKLVYVWSAKGKSFIDITKKIRELLRRFNIVLIEMDKGGGGFAIKDNLQTDKLIDNIEDKLIWDIDDKDPIHVGPKILSMINYQGEWLSKANYGLQADLQHKRFLFPSEIGEEIYLKESKETYEGSLLDEANQAWDEIERSKDEIANIVKTHTSKKEEEHFDLPQGQGVKTVRRKDRYSAVLMAADAARQARTGQIDRAKRLIIPTGGWVENIG